MKRLSNVSGKLSTKLNLALVMKALSFFCRRLFFFLPPSTRALLLFEVKSIAGRRLSRRLILNENFENYINLGAGDEAFTDFINIDFFGSPDKIDYEADLRYPLKINRASTEGIFTEHTLEHLTYDQAAELLKECYRILKPGGIIRIIVPDVSIFVENYCRKNSEWFSKWEKCMFRESQDVNRRRRKMISPMTAISFVTQEYGHMSCWDFETLEIFLSGAGFKNVKKTAFRDGADQKLLRDNDSPDRKLVSFYVEATKP